MTVEVKGYCPECGGSLFLGSGGYPTCSTLECPNPTKAADLLLDRERQHIVKLGKRTFTVRHPLREHPDGMMSCQLHEYIAELEGPPLLPGTYRVWGDRPPYSWVPISPVADPEGGEP